MPTDTATNIVNTITGKANGTVPATESPAKTDPSPAVDPNAGKEKYVVDGQERWLTPEQAKAYVQKGLALSPRWINW